MVPFYKNRQFRVAIALALVLALGILLGKFLIVKKEFNNPRLATFNGEAIYMTDVEAGMTPAERSGNSLQYKKHLAANLIRDKLLAQLAAKDGLSVQEYVKKIKQGAQSAISNEELDQFLRESGMKRSKLDKNRLENIKANMQERKREIYFQGFMKKEMANNKISWDNP